MVQKKHEEGWLFRNILEKRRTSGKKRYSRYGEVVTIIEDNLEEIKDATAKGGTAKEIYNELVPNKDELKLATFVNNFKKYWKNASAKVADKLQKAGLNKTDMNVKDILDNTASSMLDPNLGQKIVHDAAAATV